MKKQKNILAIIPARGGSKGIPRKNLRPLNGKPLIAHTIEAVLKSRHINRVIVSTEDKEIAEISRKYGAEVPFMRPKELAQDTTPTDAVVENLLKKLDSDEQYHPNIIILLQATSPLRDSADIDEAIELFLRSNAESLISVSEAKHPLQMHFTIGDEGFLKHISGKKFTPLRRQDMLKTFIPNGAIYVTSLKNYLKYKSTYTSKILPYIMPAEKSVDIDEQQDLDYVEFLLKRRK